MNEITYRRDPAAEAELERLRRCGLDPFDEQLRAQEERWARIDRIYDFTPAGDVGLMFAIPEALLR